MLLFTTYNMISNVIVKYDMYKEPNEAEGYTVNIGEYTWRDYRLGKKQNELRKYHKKGMPIEDEKYWK